MLSASRHVLGMVQSALCVLTPLVRLRALWHRRYECPYFADEEIEAQGLRNWPKVIQLLVAKSELWPGLVPEPVLPSLSRQFLFVLTVIPGRR